MNIKTGKLSVNETEDTKKAEDSYNNFLSRTKSIRVSPPYKMKHKWERITYEDIKHGFHLSINLHNHLKSLKSE